MKRLMFSNRVLSAGISIVLLWACSTEDSDDVALARIGGETIYQSEPDFILSTMPVNQKSKLAEKEEYQRFFNSLVETRIFSVAGKKAVPTARSYVRSKGAELEARDLSRFYFQKALQEYMGKSPDDLRAYYRKHAKDFRKDSVQPEFDEVIQQVAKSFVLAEADLDAWYSKNSKRYYETMGAEIALIFSDTLAKIEKAAAEIAAGKSFAEVAKKYSELRPSADKGGKIGWVRKGERRYELSRLGNVDSLIFLEKSRLKPGQTSKVLQRGKGGGILRVDAYRDGRQPALKDVRKRVENDFLTEYSRELLNGRLAELETKFKIERVPVPPPDAKSHYAKNRDRYKTKTAYSLHHLQNSDSAALAAVLPGLKTPAAFVDLGKSLNQNKITAARGGDVGKVKATHALPWGIGMMPVLFREIADKKVGYRTGVLKSPDTKQYHVFLVDSVFPPMVKPFDRVKRSIEIQLTRGGDAELDSSTVLVTMKGKPLVRESDVLNLKKEIPPQQLRRFTRDSLTRYLVTWEAYARDARRLKLDKLSEFRALQRLREANLWASVYRDSIMNRNFGLSDKKLKTIWEANRKVFPGDFEKSKRDLALFEKIPDIAYREEFVIHSGKYKADSSQSWTDFRPQLFRAVKLKEDRNIRLSLLRELREKLGVKIFVDSLVDSTWESLPAALAKAKELYTARKVREAKASYARIRATWRENSGLDEVALSLAQIHMEEKKYQDALNEYTILARIYPESKHAYKAVFMMGFILAEHLKKTDDALAPFREVLKRFPKSDLADDAEWMIKNIESGGTLAPKFLDSLSRAADSLDRALKKKAPPSAHVTDDKNHKH